MARARSKPTARSVASLALAEACAAYPDIPPLEPDCSALSPADTRLAIAIHRTAMQRFLTLRLILDRFLSKKMHKLEPSLQGVLLAGAAQLVFMDRLPAYAVVDESVGLARTMVRKGAMGLANAVLRRIANVAGSVMPDVPWAPARNRLPFDAGCIALSDDLLPDPQDEVSYLSAATSHPRKLVQDWFEAFGRERAVELLCHSLKRPPTFVQDETGSATLWEGEPEALPAWLAEDPARRVQDPTAAQAVAATAGLPIASALDLCAGRGTKTRQLLAAHPAAIVYASDPDAGRFDDVRGMSQTFDRLRVVEPDGEPPEPVDLVVLDVPCSNTGVLARRPEARYRYTPRHLASLAALQRSIIERAIAHVKPGGWVLYTTCSVAEVENQKQAKALLRLTGGELEAEQQTLPDGVANEYHDGGYHALVRVKT